jgi:hypothetical protein
LLKEIIGPSLDASDPFHIWVRRGEYNHRQEHGCGILSDLPTHFMARHVRHHDIEQHQVRSLPFDLFQGLRAGTSGVDRVTRGFQEISQEFHDVGRIIYNENFSLIGHDFLGLLGQYTEPSRKVHGCLRTSLRQISQEDFNRWKLETVGGNNATAAIYEKPEGR